MRFWFTVAVGIIVLSGLGTALVVLKPDSFTRVAKTSRTPPTPHEGENGPLLEFDVEKVMVEIPRVPQLTEGETPFKIWNAGKATLTVQLGDKTCGCAALRIEKDGKIMSRFAKTKELEEFEKKQKQDEEKKESPRDALIGQGNIDPQAEIKLEPGDEATFILEWDSKDQVGLKQIVGELWSNDSRTDRRKVEFGVRLQITPEILFSPGVVNFGQLREGQPREETLFIYSIARDDLDVKFQSASNPAITVQIRPMTDEEKQPLYAKSGFHATVIVNGQLPVGDFNERVNVMTNVTQHPEQAFGVMGFVNGLIEVLPGQVDFGVVSADGKVRKRVLITARGLAEEEALRVDEKRIQPEFIGTELKRNPEAPQVWNLELYLKSTTYVGQFRGTIPLVDAKGETRVNLLVQGTVAGTGTQ